MADNFNQIPQINQQDANVQAAVNQALLEQKKKKKKKNLIIIAVIVAVVLIIAVATSSSGDEPDTDTGSTPSSNSIEVDEDETVEGEIGDFVCTIKSAEVCKDWVGKDAIKITYEFTNNSSSNQSFDMALTDSLYQDGIGLETAISGEDDDDWGLDVEIKPGITKEVTKYYNLRDKTTPVEIEIEELFSFSDDVLTYTVELQ